jgi:hypothetical protein
LANAFTVGIKEEPHHQDNHGVLGQRRHEEKNAMMPPKQGAIS